MIKDTGESKSGALWAFREGERVMAEERRGKGRGPRGKEVERMLEWLWKERERSRDPLLGWGISTLAWLHKRDERAMTGRGSGKGREKWDLDLRRVRSWLRIWEGEKEGEGIRKTLVEWALGEVGELGMKERLAELIPSLKTVYPVETENEKGEIS